MATLYIIRGIPGSGKSTLARRLVHESRHREADMFFMRGGLYYFDQSKQKDAHAWCQGEVEKMLAEKSDCAVSNTFTRRWEYQPYLEMAAEAGFDVQVIDCHGNWQNCHGVPESVLIAMRNRWEPHRMPNQEFL